MGPGTIAIFVIAPVLLWAGLEKVRDIKPVAGTVRGLGLPWRFSTPIAAALAGAEILLALLVIFAPANALTHTGLLILAVLFAATGLVAIVSGKSISCNCFGVSGSGHLGRSQLFELPLWLTAIGFLRYGETVTPSVETGAAYLAGISLALAGIQGIRVFRAQIEARRDRQSANEMYIWLQRS